MLVEAAAASSGVVFAAAQTELLARSTRLVAQALNDPALMPSLPRRLQAEAAAVAQATAGKVPAIVNTVITPAAKAGTASGEASAKAAGGSVPWWVTLPAHQPNSAAKVADDLTSELNAAAQRITRFADDAYKAATAEAAARQVSGELVPKAAQQHAWRDLMGQGITGYTDTSGRNWNLATYTEMAVRTASARAYRASQRERMTLMGIVFFTISHTGRPCPLCAPWEGKVLGDMGEGTFQQDGHTVNVAATVEEAIAGGLFHPNCFPGETLVTAPTGVQAADSRWYEGDLVVIKTASGNELSVTPNHPILTPQGWVEAGKLVVGGDVIRYCGDVKRVDGVGPDDDLIPAPIGDVFNALAEASTMPTVRVPASAEQFHGDGEGSDVEVVLSDRLLQDNGIDPAFADGRSNRTLFHSGVRFLEHLIGGSLDEIGVTALHPADGVMGGLGVLGTLCSRHAGMATLSGLRQVGLDASSTDPGTDSRLLSADRVGDLLLGLSGQVALDSIVLISSRKFAGQVYNLQSGGGWYTASSIVVHNCKHTLESFRPGTTLTTHTPWTAAQEAEYQNTQRLRALERQARAARTQYANAITPADKAHARQRVSNATAAIKAHTAQTGLLRRPNREHPNLGFKDG